MLLGNSLEVVNGVVFLPFRNNFFVTLTAHVDIFVLLPSANRWSRWCLVSWTLVDVNLEWMVVEYFSAALRRQLVVECLEISVWDAWFAVADREC